MSIHFHRLAVKEIKKETADCVSVSFYIPEYLKKNFSFTQGQNLTMRTIINGEEVRRSYSICSSPLEEEVRVAIKKLEGGLFSTYANEQLNKGDVVEVMEPSGKFNTPLDPLQKKHYLAFAAGSGITPVISLIKTTLLTEPLSSFTLIYGNRSRSSIIFFEELEGLKNKFIDRFNLVHILSRERTDSALNFGRLTTGKLKELEKLFDYKSVDEYFICGPQEMIFCIKDYLEQTGIDKKKIHFELFTSSGKKQIVGSSQLSVQTGTQSNITIKADGRSIEFKLPLNSDATILDAALKQGADLPYACKGGMCCTCKAKLEQGEVTMDVHWGLEEDEIEKGFILTCQSHPKSETIVLDFDIK
ncbi:MAG: phenylacetate-CoA oxygenase/reductase subunit PaaK [Sphingobacteriales bacterium]|nr:phenylacetate-CoA oxygenase/reductase subunit PaaK [Sphingobacteriales bacterium]